MGLWHYLKSLHDLYGWCKIKVATLMRKYHRSEASINRWLGALRAAGFLLSEQHGQACCVYTILEPKVIGQSDRPEPPASLHEPSEEVCSNEQTISSDDAPALPEIARKTSGFERLSEGDRRYLAELQRAGTSPDAFRAAILVGRARRAVAESNWALTAAREGRLFRAEPIRSLRYFGTLLAEKFAAGYVEHVAGWLERRKTA